jgi:hypothetical protein
MGLATVKNLLDFYYNKIPLLTQYNGKNKLTDGIALLIKKLFLLAL